MGTLARAAVVTGDVAAGIRIVATNLIAHSGEQGLGRASDAGRTGGAVRVAQNDIGAAAVRTAALRRHRVAVDQQASAEALFRGSQKAHERLVVRLPIRPDAESRFL